LALASRTTPSLGRRFPLSDSLLEHACGEQIARFDAFLLEFRKGHRTPIFMHASADNLAQLYNDVLQSFPLFGR